MRRFNNFYDFKYYIEENISYSMHLEEHRLYSEEQYQMINNKKVCIYQNSIEWIIRLNKVLKFINYSIRNTLKFIDKDFNIIKDSENKDMYSYYLEDSAYRVIVGWDMYKQLVNEIYEVGLNRGKNYSIYKLIKKIEKNNIWNSNEINNLNRYINSKKHKYVRNYLRNSFAHSIDPTSIYVFNSMDSSGNILTSNIDNMIPKHPFENLLYIVEDLKQLYDYIELVNKYIFNKLHNEIMLVNIKLDLKCGSEFVGGIVNIKTLRENINNIMYGSFNSKCEECEYSTKVDGRYHCKPNKITYNRIHDELRKTLEV